MHAQNDLKLLYVTITTTSVNFETLFEALPLIREKAGRTECAP